MIYVKTIGNRIIICKDLTPYVLRTTANKLAEKLCRDCGLAQTIVFKCGTCKNYHILDEKPSWAYGH